ncbi:hypothetical protein NFI96_023001 [Prochilodus magdalenae]|nr:hypothetical protein NFI96_023001 [Prochilodus magdalenae]
MKGERILLVWCMDSSSQIYRTHGIIKHPVGGTLCCPLVRGGRQCDEFIFVSPGIHTVQWTEGCELDDDGTKRGYSRFGYDGEDFISLDVNTLTWTPANDVAVVMKQKLEQTDAAASEKTFLETACIKWLWKYVDYGNETLNRTVPPEVSLFQKDSSSPVVCHATGFFPKPVSITWQKNGEDLYEDVELRETLPNLDDTFQRRSILTVSPEELNKHTYTCIIQHSSLEKAISLQVKPRGEISVGVLIGIIIGAAVLVILVGVGVYVWVKRRNNPESYFPFKTKLISELLNVALEDLVQPPHITDPENTVGHSEEEPLERSSELHRDPKIGELLDVQREEDLPESVPPLGVEKKDLPEVDPDNKTTPSNEDHHNSPTSADRGGAGEVMEEEGIKEDLPEHKPEQKKKKTRRGTRGKGRKIFYKKDPEA